MSVITIADASTRPEIGHFYVPRFEIKIEGVGLPRDILRDVVQVTYKDNIKEIDSFELTVNNWDSNTRNFKYIGSETKKDLEGHAEDSQRFKIFEPCQKEVEVRMGYLDNLQLMLKGTFSTMEPNFPNSGAPTLNVRGLNVLHQLRAKQYTYAWEKKKPSFIAQNIATLRDPSDPKKKRFPLPITVSKTQMKREEEIDYVTQQNQYDIDFLLTLARQHGYVVFVHEGDKDARLKKEREKHLYFGPSNGPSNEKDLDLAEAVIELKWGMSLVDFKPTLTTANQIKSVTVNGWDRKSKEAIKVTVDLNNEKLKKVNPDLHEILARCDPRDEYVVDEPIFTEKEAQKRAEAILLDRQKEIVKASATCVGWPELRAGRTVQIEGIGCRLSGKYFITDSTHVISNSGYMTKFSARRENPGEHK